METQPDDIIIFGGITYTRKPSSPRKHLRRYWWPPRDSGKDALHREIWKSVHGPIPPGCHVHHRDRNPLNNDIGNLVCLTRSEHAAAHRGECSERKRANLDAVRPLASAWHGSEAGLAFHSELGRKSWEGREADVSVTCTNCGKESPTYFPGKSGERFCSNRCHRAKADRERRYEREVPCQVCGTVFWQNAYRPKPETCSRLCGAALRKRRRAGVQPDGGRLP